MVRGGADKFLLLLGRIANIFQNCEGGVDNFLLRLKISPPPFVIHYERSLNTNLTSDKLSLY